MIAVRQGPSIGSERFPLPACHERWLDFLALEHATLPLPVDFEREGEELLVRRAPIAGRKISAGRIPMPHAPLLFLQAAGLCSFLQAFGFWLSEEDLSEAVHDMCEGGPRLWLTRTPASIAVGGPGPAPSAVLAAFLHRLFARAQRLAHPAARSLFDSMLAGDAPFRRAEFWLASAFRAFRELAEPGASLARMRTIGLAGPFLRDGATRARMAKARSLCEGRPARIFAAGPSALTPGAALGLAGLAGGVAQAARALRESHSGKAGGRPSLWIAVEPGRWDLVSRRAFETAARALGDEVEVSIVEGAPAPRLADEWRREIFVPCGTLSASLRFYDEFARLARPQPAAARSLAETLTASPPWAAFVGDPTGDAPLPAPHATAPPRGAEPLEPAGLEREILEALAVSSAPVAGADLARLFPRRATTRALHRLRSRHAVGRDPSGRWSISASGSARVGLTPARRGAAFLRWAQIEEDPGRRIELLLEAGDVEGALAAGERWHRAAGSASPERWFALSSRLAAAAGQARPPWLELLEAEREIAGGRLEEARARLATVEPSTGASAEETRAARLRAAETLALRGRHGAAGREAALWRGDFPEAPAAECVRALRIEASSRAREGEHANALRLLDEAQRQGAAGSLEDRLETALARADVYSLSGRFREEHEIYERWRSAVLSHGDDRLTARLLAREALGLSDRREFAASIARLEQALAVTRDDPVERARLEINLVATLFHAGRTAACGALLEEAIGLASCAGREDFVRVARGNRVELAIHRGEWEEASREIAALLAEAEAEKDDVRRLVALHQRSRVLLRRGYLEEAEKDNREARELASRLCDRLEIGELWLEEGDRAVYAGDLEGARGAWERAAADPPDRCDTDIRARERLRELSWRHDGSPPAEALAELADALARNDYAAAEKAARWRMIFVSSEGPLPPLAGRAQEILRARGGAALADRVFGPPVEEVPAPATAPLRALRDAVASALSGDPAEAPLAALALEGLVLRDEEGREIARFASREPGAARPLSRRLAAGAARYELLLWPAPAPERADAIALLLETLLYRAAPARPPVEFAEGWGRFRVITGDVSMEEPYRRLVRFAPQPVTVLVLGESGSGKEGAARAVHQLSPRAAGPFVAVNVPAIPEALLESELFGHARGAFTGADRDRRGLLEEAQSGTIFFDEIGDLTLPLQAKLLRALQEREVRRVGENRPRPIDVRVVSATSRPLADQVERGAFREDLYYRLHVAVIALPPLRDRGRDVVLIARHLLARFAREYGRGNLQFSPEALAALSAHGWPGNVRELQNVVAQAAALAEPNGLVTPEQLPEALRRERRPPVPSDGYRSRVNAHRRGLIAEALERSGGNRTRAARDLGLSRQALLYLIRELNVPSRPRSNH